MEDNKKVQLSFLALNPYQERNIPAPTEKVLQGKDMVEWGDKNRYPEFLWDLYCSVPTLRSIINGTKDFIVEEDNQIATNDPFVEYGISRKYLKTLGL